MFQIILLVGCIQSILLAVYMLAISKVRGSGFLGFLLLLMSVHLFLAANDSQAFFMAYPHLLHITWVMPALYGPVLLLFIHRLTFSQPSDIRIYFAYFFAFGLVLAWNTPFFLQSADAKRAYILDFERSVKDDFGLTNQLVALLHILYFGYGYFLLGKYQQKIDQYTAIVEARLQWLGHFLLLVIAVATLGFVALYARSYHWPVLAHIYPYHFLGILFLIYWCAFRLLRQPEIFHNESALPHFAQKEMQEEPLADESQRKLAQRITVLMEQDKMYLKAGLSLQELCDATQSNKQYVSQALNQIHGKSFYDFVNDYRLAHFVSLMTNPANAHLKLLGLAMDAGFNSKATFNTVFKKKFGVTPSAYQKRLRAGSN